MTLLFSNGASSILNATLFWLVYFRGVGAMEIVAMDMKLRGMYIARQLSFTGVTFKIEEVPLTQDYIKMYNKAVRLVCIMPKLKQFFAI